MVDRSYSASINNTLLSVDTYDLHSTKEIPYHSFDMWHFRLEHPSMSIMHLIQNKHSFVTTLNNKICDTCRYAKQKRLSFLVSHTKSSAIFDLVHIDVWGLFKVMFVHGHGYFFTMMDNFSRHTWLFLMKHKFETTFLIQSFINLIETQVGTKLKAFRSENGPKFNMIQFFTSKCTIHQTSYVETPQ